MKVDPLNLTAGLLLGGGLLLIVLNLMGRLAL